MRIRNISSPTSQAARSIAATRSDSRVVPGLVATLLTAAAVAIVPFCGCGQSETSPPTLSELTEQVKTGGAGETETPLRLDQESSSSDPKSAFGGQTPGDAAGSGPSNDPSSNPDSGPVEQPLGETPLEETPLEETGASGEGAEPETGERAPTGGEAPVSTEAVDDDFPFEIRIPAPDFPKEADWLNTGGPLRKQDLKGKFVLLDFWTYCCINCIHILPELKKLERAYPNELVVIGVHSAKFETEKESKNIEDAILRYEIEHPVVNDPDHRIWQAFGVRSWPTVLLIDPQGNAVWGRAGEIKFEDVAKPLEKGLAYFRKKGLLDTTPIRFDLLANRRPATPLRFPGKVLADERGNRLFISDSNNNRIVIATLDGKLLDTIGSGRIGRRDGGYADASFDHPQGVALVGETLFVADTENHMIRKVDLAKKQVTTVAGVGKQARNAWPGSEDLAPGSPLPQRWVGPAKTTALNSPWALWVHETDLYIAMAGTHQIWKMPLDESEIGPYAGNGREDIVDGPLVPRTPYEEGYSSLAQPSGLTSDGTWLYVADSEGSSIRAVPMDGKGSVRTVVGTSELPHGRLFEFGDRDGRRADVLLQHALGVSFHDGVIYVADTYNNKIKAVDAESGETKTLAGSSEPGLADDPPQFDEPAGLSYAAGRLYIADTNNHAIRAFDLKTGKIATLAIAGLEPPASRDTEKPVSFDGAAQVALKRVAVTPQDGKITLDVRLALPLGYKINLEAPMAYKLEMEGKAGPIRRDQAGRHKLEKPADRFTVPLQIDSNGQDTVKVSLNYYYCQDGGEGLCKFGSVVFTVPIQLEEGAGKSEITLKHTVK